MNKAKAGKTGGKPETQKTEAPSEADIYWAKKHGWIWDGEAFSPAPVIRVIPNPMNHPSGWCPWLPAIGALQIDAPFNVRAALRVAEEIRRQRPLGPMEMNCSEDPDRLSSV